MPEIKDKGQWEIIESDAYEEGIAGVLSDDFEYDVLLTVSGDFPGRETKRKYCEWLCDTLNKNIT